MTVSVEPPRSSNDRPLRLRIRPELESQLQTYHGANYWLVKDPVSLKYYRFEPEEFFILKMLDGQTSPSEIQRRFAKQFAPQQITLPEIHRLTGQLYRCSLIVAESAGQGAILAKRNEERQRDEFRGKLINPLSIRFKGIDPDKILAMATRWFGWFFTSWAVGLNLCFITCTALFVACQLDVILWRLPDFHQFFSVQNWLLLAIVLGITKVCHEFGHGIACKRLGGERLGGECHEMGFMLLVFTPCLYCNVSDSWMLPNKWHRAAIGAAGMYVELVIAALAAWVWRYSDAGAIHDLCLGTMFTCSVSTLMFNANPLMRYDGYYILSDVLELPNLRQKSTIALKQILAKQLLGLPIADSALPRRGQFWFAIYALAATIYSWAVTFAILGFLYYVLEPYGAKVLGQLLVLGVLAGGLFMTGKQLVSFLSIPGQFERISKLRLAVTTMVTIGGVLFLALVPLPHRVHSPLQLLPRNANAVYVDVAGTIESIMVQPGEQVVAGQPLVRLRNTDIDLAVVELEGERNRLKAKIENLRKASLSSDSAADIAGTEKALDTVLERLEKRRADLDRLIIRAPTGGHVLSAPPVVHRRGNLSELTNWSGTPLDKNNVGAFLDEATMVCRVGGLHEAEAMLAIDHRDIDLVRAGQRVEVQLEQQPGRRYHGTIQQVGAVDMQFAPSNLSLKAGGDVATRTDQRGQERIVGTKYQASVAFDDPRGAIIFDSRGEAKVHAGYRTVASRLWTFVTRTFQFEM